MALGFIDDGIVTVKKESNKVTATVNLNGLGNVTDATRNIDREIKKIPMLLAEEYKRLYPYLMDAVRVEIKQYSGNKEVQLEYKDGSKKVGNLLNPNFKMVPLKGLRSIEEHFARGEYGTNSYRGNCSGLLIKNLAEHFQWDECVDPSCGSNTTGDVAKELGIKCTSLDLNPKYGGFNLLSNEIPHSTKHLFYHPAYYVFPGSGMPQYSGQQWGSQPHPDDGSHIHDMEAFTKWFNTSLANCYRALRKGGRMYVLMGESRYRGQYYSMYSATCF